MDNKTIIEKLESIFKDVFDDENIKLEESANAEDIEGWDSLKHISILAAVQDEFSLSFDMDEIMGMNNVGDMVKSIKEKIK